MLEEDGAIIEEDICEGLFCMEGISLYLDLIPALSQYFRLILGFCLFQDLDVKYDHHETLLFYQIENSTFTPPGQTLCL